MNKNIENGPDMKDVEVFESGATYLRVHFVSKKYKDKTELSVIKSLANRAKALKILRSRLYEEERRRIDSERAADRKGQVGSGDRSERIRTYNYPQGRITDHRINKSIYSLDAFMNGDIQEMLDSLRFVENAEKLKENAI